MLTIFNFSVNRFYDWLSRNLFFVRSYLPAQAVKQSTAKMLLFSRTKKYCL